MHKEDTPPLSSPYRVRWRGGGKLPLRGGVLVGSAATTVVSKK